MVNHDYYEVCISNSGKTHGAWVSGFRTDGGAPKKEQDATGIRHADLSLVFWAIFVDHLLTNC